MLDMSETSYSSLIQLIADLENDPNELTNILNNISALQSGKIDKTAIVQTDTVNDTTKVPSSAVTYGLGQQIDTINNNLGGVRLWKKRAALVTNTSNNPVLTNENIQINATISGKYRIDMLTNTGVANCASSYIVFCTGSTIFINAILEGSDSRAPVLSSSGTSLVVNVRSATVQYSIDYLITKMD